MTSLMQTCFWILSFFSSSADFRMAVDFLDRTYFIILLKAGRIGVLALLLVSLIYLILNLANNRLDTKALNYLCSSTTLYWKFNSLIPDSNSIINYKKYSSNPFPNFSIFILTMVLFSFGIVCLINILQTIELVTMPIFFRNT